MWLGGVYDSSGSYTDSESVNILSTPVADMDMAAFLDKPIGDRE